MKRKMLLLALALPVVLCQNVQAQTSSRLIGQTHLVNNGASFLPVDSSAYTYSGSRGGDLNHTMKYDNAAKWMFLGDTAYNNGNVYIQTFDANSNILTKITQDWNGADWVLSTKDLNSYDGDNKITSKISQSWNGSSWVPVSQHLYIYIGAQLVADKYQTWNNLTTSFVDSMQKNYYYDVFGNKTNETDISLVSGPLNVVSYNYTYTGTNMLASSTYSTWDGASWVPTTMTTNTYDTLGNKINTMFQTYDMGTSAWVNQTLHSYSSFTSGHNAQVDVQQMWDTTGGGSWANQIEFTNSYNGYDQVTSTIGQSWNIVGAFEFALNDPMANYYYETYTSTFVHPVVVGSDVISLYPVPAENTLHLDLNWKNAQTATIAIYDMMGRVVNQWTSDYGTQYFSTISVDHLSSGTYFVKVNGAQGQIVKQFVVAH